MDWAVKAFLKSSLAWLGAGVTLGVAMAVYPPLTVYRAAHLHMNLLGLLAAAAAYVFIYNLWRTIDGRPPQRGAAPVVATRSAPVPLRRMPVG